ncbi:16S rRNA (guanine(966)-N(2))-methyltransferase RsmD [Jiella sp. MQZ9-1]|uniref:16S rRNA (Guanine(966)-N(2))-methyltransferase RsmD n=1 Tax=Jiella flava TaxID=2816857 RepID=A0A939JVM3_9HYPH|nr:16S rRNA (guanine(966)-N(2))-methyltransferase RsmD [Jiella flava]MBO0662122.1 16S rRNA (guanine(966)-N(2))-methyltransferase RsmD [Jiella flava]MCD2470549.1 16S rRNA (guanine(966)-N(2))-methyltransferase RsmD [Jiella flava]
MRIVAGEFRGRKLAEPKSDRIRPTTDRNRETLFNILAHRREFDLVDARILDLFSGTGALGFEALSRGARFCLFVEEDVEARGLIRSNMEAFGLNGRAKIFRRDATKLGVPGTMEPFDMVFADPPYAKGLGERALASACEGGWLKPNAVAVLEEATDAPFALPDGFDLIEERPMGATILRFCSVKRP